MIDILLKDGTIKKFLSLDKLDIDLNEIIYIHLIESNEEEMIELSNKFKFILQPLDKRNEIEISSRYVEDNSQIFQSKNFNVNENVSGQRIALLFLSALTDYYADLVELVSKKVKEYFKKILNLKNISLEELDNLTKIKLDNIQLKECLIELQRIILQLNRSPLINEKNKNFLAYENKDLAVINGHINYNFDRLNDLKENISSKIELEQNQIIKIFRDCCKFCVNSKN